MSIVLRSPCPDDEAAFLRAVTRSRDVHHPWVSPPDTHDSFINYLAKYSGDTNAGFIAINNTGEIVGCIHINAIIRGPFRSAFLGYYGFVPFIGKGLMKKAMSLAIDQAFGPLELHRLEANIQPDNHASVALIRSLGFRHEGFSPRYLQISDEWRDHDRYAITIEDWQPPQHADSD